MLVIFGRDDMMIKCGDYIWDDWLIIYGMYVILIKYADDIWRDDLLIKYADNIWDGCYADKIC